MTSYSASLQSWDEALAVLAAWIPGFSVIRQPDKLSFDCVAEIMAAVPDGFQSIPIVFLDSDGAFIKAALERFWQRPSEFIVIPDCGMVSRLPLRLPVLELTRFLADFDYACASQRIGLLDGTSDIFFGFDTGDMLLIDHDERFWFSPAKPL